MEQLRDISNNNGSLTKADFVAWKQQGVLGVYLKVTEGLTFVDGRAAQFRQWAQEVGLLYGEYHFFHPNLDAREQARFFLDHSHSDAELVPALDLESYDGCGYGVIRWQATKFLIYVKVARHCKPLLYTYPAFALCLQGLQGWPLWISDPDRRGDARGPRTGPWRTYALWQDDTQKLDKDTLGVNMIEAILRSKSKSRETAAALRAKTGFWSWLAWRLGEGAWKGWGVGNSAVRPHVSLRIHLSWWHKLAAFIAARG